MGENLVLWFKELGLDSLSRVGGKNASLGELLRAGINVPPGFAVTTRAYQEFLGSCDIGEKTGEILARVDPNDLVGLERAGSEIRGLFRSVPVPKPIADAIQSSYHALSDQCNVPDLSVAVRSSATAEDLPGASFAGQQDTFLGVRGRDKVLERVVDCWSSLFTPRAISYRVKMGFPHEVAQISVGVQKLVNARAAGVMFTLNPITGDPSKIFIEANWGLGESVVKGEITPDRYVVDKVVMSILSREPAPKSLEYIMDRATGLVVTQPVPSGRQTHPCLEDREVLELAHLGKLIERHYRTPQDVEWAIDADLPFPDNVLILQSRPETVWSGRQAAPVVNPREGPTALILDEFLRRAGMA